MKKTLKRLLTMLVAMVMLNVCGITLHAEHNEYFGEPEWLNEVKTENEICIKDKDGRTYVWSCRGGDDSVYSIVYGYGIVIEAEAGITKEALLENPLIAELAEKYKFTKSNCLAPPGGTAMAGLADITANAFVFYIPEENDLYPLLTDEEVEELIEYAAELRTIDYITRSEVFRISCSNKGWFWHVNENNAVIFLGETDNPLDVDKLNSDVQLQQYLKEIGAEPEIQIYESLGDYYYAIVGIDEREKILEIRDTLNTFEVIDGKAFIMTSWQMSSSTRFRSESYANHPDGSDIVPSIPITTPAETTTTTVTTTTTTTTTQITDNVKLVGDIDGDNEITVRDCSRIAVMIAEGKSAELSDNADFNKDGKVNVRDAAAIAKTLAKA